MRISTLPILAMWLIQTSPWAILCPVTNMWMDNFLFDQIINFPFWLQERAVVARSLLLHGRQILLSSC